MRVRVKLYATLGRQRPGVAPGYPFEVELGEGATIGDLLTQLGLEPAEAKVTFVNGRARPLDWTLQPDDEVGVFPPIGGG